MGHAGEKTYKAVGRRVVVFPPPPIPAKEPVLDRAAVGREVTLAATIAYPGTRVTDVRLGTLTLQVPNHYLLGLLDPPPPSLEGLVVAADAGNAELYLRTPRPLPVPQSYGREEQLRAALRSAYRAMDDVLTGVGVHNGRLSGEEQRFRVEGPVVTALGQVCADVRELLRSCAEDDEGEEPPESPPADKEPRSTLEERVRAQILAESGGQFPTQKGAETYVDTVLSSITSAELLRRISWELESRESKR